MEKNINFGVTARSRSRAYPRDNIVGFQSCYGYDCSTSHYSSFQIKVFIVVFLFLGSHSTQGVKGWGGG